VLSSRFDEKPLEVRAAFVDPLLERIRALDVDAVEEWAVIQLDRPREHSRANVTLEVGRVERQRRIG